MRTHWRLLHRLQPSSGGSAEDSRSCEAFNADSHEVQSRTRPWEIARNIILDLAWRSVVYRASRPAQTIELMACEGLT